MAEEDAPKIEKPDLGQQVWVQTGDTVEVTTRGKRRWKIHVPSVFTILFFLTIIAVAATWFVPAGSYAKLRYDSSSNEFLLTSPTGDTSTLPGTQEFLDELEVKIDLEQFTSGALTKPVLSPTHTSSSHKTPKTLVRSHKQWSKAPLKPPT